MGFPAEIIKKVWEKAATVPENSPDEWRKDECGAWIGRDHYGNRSSQYGWEVDHITCVALGGSDALSNLRPLQWQNNASRQDGRLVHKVTSSGNRNVER